MTPVVVRNVKIGEGIPKICIPIVGNGREEIYRQAEQIKKTSADLVEWRADWFETAFDEDCLKEVLIKLREILEDIPLLFTFRSVREGGEKEIDAEQYASLNKAAIKTGCVDLVDIELSLEETVIQELVRTAHNAEVKVIISNHDFYRTPEKQEIVQRLRNMQRLGADIPKIAVMPQKKEDVLTLLAATAEMADIYAEGPIITMSMAGTGLLSRISGEIFGSAVTFGSAGRASAPGQIDYHALKNVLELLHQSL